MHFHLPLNPLFRQATGLDFGSDEDSDSESGTEDQEHARIPSASRTPRQNMPTEVASDKSSDSEEMFPETRPARTKVFGNTCRAATHHIFNS